MKKTLTVVFAIITFVALMAMMPADQPVQKTFHSPEEMKRYLSQHVATPIDSSQYFLKPSECRGCHGFDPTAQANVDGLGNDVNLYDDWETSMMGLSAVDPLWRAKVSHEILVNPSHTNELQTLCTKCHAPLGNYTAHYKGFPYYTLANLVNDSLGISGVSCGACHAIKDSSILGSLFTGIIPYDTNRIEYGPFTNMLTGPMQLYVGLTPTFSEHVSKGKMCSSCHTLISNTVDLNGVPTGATFVEQSTYHEWLNSSFPGLNITCQTCHMPQIEDPVVLANGNIALNGQSPFNLHQFAGGNSFMVNLIKNNKNSLGVTASDANFDSTLVAIDKMLKQNALFMNATADSVMNDTAYISVIVLNNAGHKFPSGYPSRRAVLQLVATDLNGDTLFSSGLFDANEEVININPFYEPHHDVITSSLQTQIYEMVMGDVNGDKTTVLERSASKIKDNRIPPLGYTTTHYSYDTTYIAGSALTDPDFNKDGISEGTGKDIVHYHIPLNGFTGLFNLSASLYFQSVPPAWLSELFSYSSAEIDTFRNMYASADKTPVLLLNDTIQHINVNTGLNDHDLAPHFTIWPNPSSNGIVFIGGDNNDLDEIKIYNLKGQYFESKFIKTNKNLLQINLPAASGVYFIQINTSKGSTTKRVLKI